MKEYEEKMKKFLCDNSMSAEHITFDKSVHTVEEACAEAKASPDDFVKTICMVGSSGETIGALVLGSNRASTKRVAKALESEKPNVASPEEVLERTGFLVGGTPPFGYEAVILIDPLVIEKEYVYIGGGSPQALVKISTKELLAVTKGKVVRVRK